MKVWKISGEERARAPVKVDTRPRARGVIVLTLVCLLLTLITSNAASAEEQALEIDWKPDPPPPPQLPVFSDLTITPVEIEPGDDVTISVDIESTYYAGWTYIVYVHIRNVNGLPYQWPPYSLILKTYVELGAYESKTVSRTITMYTVQDYKVTMGGLTGSFTVKSPEPPLTPAEFVVSDLSITPEEVEEGEAVTVSVDVTNVGEETGAYTVELMLDGIVVGSEEIIPLEGGLTTTVSFDVTRNEGTYQVEIDGLTGSFTVKAAPEPEYEVSDLTITPDEVELGDEVTVSFVITNADSRSYVFLPFVQIGDMMIMEDVELEGHESRTVSHTITPESVGYYDVTIDGLEGGFTVKPEPSRARVNIVEPADGDVVYDKVRITAEVSDVDDDPLTVSFFINDIVIHTVELTDTVIAQDVPYIWDTFPSYEDGSYEVSVTASDGIFTASDSIAVVLKNRVTVAGEIVAFVAGPTPDLPIAGALLQLILDGGVQYSFVTDENGGYSFENVEPNLPGKRYDRIVLKNDVVLDIHNADRTVHYNPGVDELEEVIRIKNYVAEGGSPIDLHVYDTEGRHTGLIDGEIELGIPLSWYSGDTEPEVIVILNPAYVYDLVVFGEESGTFDLQVSNYILIDSEDTIVTINLNDVSIATGDKMPVTYDFAEIEEEISMLLNEGYSIEDAVEDVVNSIDSDGDGLVDGKEIEIGTNPLNVDSDGDMWNDAADMSPTNAIIPNVFIAGVVAAVVVAVFLLLRER